MFSKRLALVEYFFLYNCGEGSVLQPFKTNISIARA